MKLLAYILFALVVVTGLLLLYAVVTKQNPLQQFQNIIQNNDQQEVPEDNFSTVLGQTAQTEDYREAFNNTAVDRKMSELESYTIFVFDNSAVAELEELNEDFITSFIIDQRLSAEDLFRNMGENFTAIEGSRIKVTEENGELIIEDRFRLIRPNIQTTNGYVHVLTDRN